MEGNEEGLLLLLADSPLGASITLGRNGYALSLFFFPLLPIFSFLVIGCSKKGLCVLKEMEDVSSTKKSVLPPTRFPFV